ncbi:MAG: ABC transporter ATP-binding protein, partial [Rhizobiales bacterium]|nr:ABC transporter ATP-binding protein [Hyphomicrobiales bacterium]
MSVLLSVDKVEAAYGVSPALFGVSLEVREGEAVALMGRNGMGKTTLLKCVMGLIPVTSGEITFAGTDLRTIPVEGRARLAIGYVPQGREIFPQLTVEENLKVGLVARRDGRRTIPSQVFD